MYSNAITIKSLPRVVDQSRKKWLPNDLIVTPPTCDSEEEALKSLDDSVKRLHDRLRRGMHINYVTPLDVFITL